MKTSKFRVRKVDFGLEEEVPRYYIRGNAVATHLVNAMNLIFPDGERFFVRAVNRQLHHVTDTGLKADVKVFIGQEVNHGKQHEIFWGTLQRQGFNTSVFLRVYRFLAFRVFEPIMLFLNKRLPLAITAALEHYTALMAEGTFRSGALDGLPPSIRKLSIWHSAEEIEHKAVAFDVLRASGAGYGLRIVGFILGSAMLGGFAALGTIIFLWQDREVGLKRLFKDIMAIPKVLAATRASFDQSLFSYFRRDFHPNDIDNRHLAAAALAEIGL